MFNQRLSNIFPKGSFDRYIQAYEIGMIEVILYSEAKRQMQNPDHMIDATGKLSEGGTELFEDIKDYKPDIVVFDTLTTLCGANQMDDILL